MSDAQDRFRKAELNLNAVKMANTFGLDAKQRAGLAIRYARAVKEWEDAFIALKDECDE